MPVPNPRKSGNLQLNPAFLTLKNVNRQNFQTSATCQMQFSTTYECEADTFQVDVNRQGIESSDAFT